MSSACNHSAPKVLLDVQWDPGICRWVCKGGARGAWVCCGMHGFAGRAWEFAGGHEGLTGSAVTAVCPWCSGTTVLLTPGDTANPQGLGTELPGVWGTLGLRGWSHQRAMAALQ